MPKDVSEWMEKLGLGQYTSNFTNNDINTHLLVQLTDADLKELGISSLGHRKNDSRCLRYWHINYPFSKKFG